MSAAADALMGIFGYKRVHQLTDGDRFTVDGSDIVWTFQRMDGMYCRAVSSTGQVLNWSGPVNLVEASK